MATKSLLSPVTQAILNHAVASELYASNLYLHAANQMQRVGYFGAAKYFQGESAEERTHYQKLADYVNDRGSVATIPAVPPMTEAITTLTDVMQTAYDTELQLERNYVKWYTDCDCQITKQFLLWYLEEQRKSVGKYSDFLARLDRCGDDRAALLAFDSELAD